MKYIYTFLFVVISATSFAQGNLQFNQVLTFVGNTAETNIYSVPPGKVAKISKELHYYGNSSAYRTQFSFNGYPTLSTSNIDITGMWLRENDVLGTLVGTYASNYWVLSIIEYNIIP